MIRRTKHIYLNIFGVLFIYLILNFGNSFSKKKQQENHPPSVKILSPKNNSLFNFDTQINYQISVADKEDGDSKYDEINGKEILLEVRHVSKLPAILNKGVQADPAGIAIMRTSNCFNCHNFNGKAIGPSLYEINKKYPATKPNIDTLIKHISKGSSGTWGKEKMPTHKELTNEEIKSTVLWIVNHAADPDVNYYIGAAGSFRIKPPIASKSNGIYVLTASYIDRGLKNEPGKQRLKGEDVAVIRSK
ncbi:MAG TPA: c-type cytochrome [Mucilaginibacter sp.]|jgi:cytochrome c